MNKILALVLVGLLAASAVADNASIPTFGKFRQMYSGAVVSFIAGSGTNTAVEAVYEGDIPFRLADVTATVDGAAATTVTVYRVWQYVRDAYTVSVETNMFGQVETNSYLQASVVETITNTVYASGSTTLPGSVHFIQGDKMIVDFGSQTGAVVRILGAAL